MVRGSDPRAFLSQVFVSYLTIAVVLLLLGEHEADIPFILVEALSADQEGVRLCPGVLSAVRAGKLRLA